MKKETEKKVKKASSRFVLKRETLRKLRPADLEAAIGGGEEEIIPTSISRAVEYN